MILLAEHLRFAYGDHIALDDVSIRVESEERIALLGANGSGKTTFMKLLAGLLMRKAGRISLDGIDPMMLPLKFRKSLGFLPERCPLYQEMTIDEYLIYRARLKGERMLRVRRRVNEVIALCDLEDVRADRIDTLSQGYRKRVGVADTLLRHPKVLLLDDPLAALDAVAREKTLETLRSAAGRSAVMVSGHDVDDLLAWCTRAIVLRRGRIVCDQLVGTEIPKEQRAEIVSYLR